MPLFAPVTRAMFECFMLDDVRRFRAAHLAIFGSFFPPEVFRFSAKILQARAQKAG